MGKGIAENSSRDPKLISANFSSALGLYNIAKSFFCVRFFSGGTIRLDQDEYQVQRVYVLQRSPPIEASTQIRVKSD